MPIKKLVPALLFLVMLAAGWLVYSPGMQGEFLFDDYVNLPTLGVSGPIDDAPAFWRYITSGSADPTGRPIALLSFLVDAQDWPADPYPFKRTAVLLHMLNGVLLVSLLLKLGRGLHFPELQAESAAVVGAAFWLLHPLFVSTTLYVVQREAMLPATFIILGLLGYTIGRTATAKGNASGIAFSAASVACCTALAIFSKANGALLPLFVWVVERTALRRAEPIDGANTRRLFAWMQWIVVIVPTLLLAAFLAWQAYSGFAHGVDDIRPWTLGQRLLTESRIVTDYLHLLWWPRPYTAGLFNDAYSVSTGLFAPPTTVLCMAFLAALFGAAIAYRRRYPVIAVAVLFFFVGHILESTVVPLELYFEHRNYVPALLLFWPLALWLCAQGPAGLDSIGGFKSVSTPASIAPVAYVFPFVARMGIAGAIACLLITFTYLRAQLWGQSHDQAIIWAQKNPDSPRAQAYAAQVELGDGRNSEAVSRLDAALTKTPNDVQLALNMIGARCASASLSANDLTRAANALRSEPNTGRLGYDWFERSLPTAMDGSCPGLNMPALQSLLQAASENTRAQKIPGRRQDVLHMQGRIALLQGNADVAMDFFDQALKADPRPDSALEQAAYLASAGRSDLALRHLDTLDKVWNQTHAIHLNMPSIHNWVLWRQGYWQHEIEHLRRVLAEDLKPREPSAAPLEKRVE